ncbi:hypothetical protein SETIT_5G256200v2 [Setaria italica]|uniref:Ribosomal protein S7 domain-containing protein n=1 Tax=Setaria italica TaxID=4555 RepID=K3XPJ3_SETIT|nr:hypothetical protein SETIT_5G256200v2 [Setaria italica]
MSRRGTSEKRIAKSDPIFRNRLVNMVLIKKALAYQILYRAVKKIGLHERASMIGLLVQFIRDERRH